MNIPTDAELLATIDAFLKRHDMAPTRFGRDATGEPQLIDSIRKGRSPSLNTLQRIADFMAEKDVETDQGDVSPFPADASSDRKVA